MSKWSADGKTLKLKWDRTRIALQGCHWDMRAPDSEKHRESRKRLEKKDPVSLEAGWPDLSLLSLSLPWSGTVPLCHCTLAGSYS